MDYKKPFVLDWDLNIQEIFDWFKQNQHIYSYSVSMVMGMS